MCRSSAGRSGSMCGWSTPRTSSCFRSRGGTCWGYDEEEAGQRVALADRLGVEPPRDTPCSVSSATTVGRCTACDHVLYDLGDSRYAIVHLTWTASPPDQPPWPRATMIRLMA